MSFGAIAASYLTVATDPSYTGLVMSHSPLLYWRLGDASGTVAVDSSGNNRNGTYVNNPSLGEQPLAAGDSATSIYIDKFSDQWVEGNYGAWMNTSAITVTCAYRCAYDSGGNVIEALAARYWDASSDISWLLYCENSEFKFYYRTTGGSIITIASGVTRNLGDTYYVSAYAGAGGAGIRIYSGGTLLGSVTGMAAAVATSPRPLTVAGTDATGADSRHPITGNFQEIAYFDSVLSSSDLDALASVATAPQPGWHQRTAGVAPRNGTAAHTLTFPAAGAGSLLVAIVTGSVTSATSAPGWTKSLSAINACELAVFTCTASGGETSLALTHNGSNYPLNYVVYEFAAGSAWLNGAANNNGVPPDITGLPGTPAVAFSAITMTGSDLGDSTVYEARWDFGWTEDVDAMTANNGVTDGAYLTVGWRRLYTETTVSPDTEGFYGGAVYHLSDQTGGVTSITFVLDVS